MAIKTTKKKKITSRKSMKWYQRGAMTFVVLSLMLLITVLYLAISKSTIIVVAKPQTITAPFSMRIIDQPVQAGDVTGFVRQESFEINRSFTLPSEGSSPINARATGTVTLINDSNIPQQLVATTRLLSSDNILFRLDEGITVPANGSINARVTADEEGPASEIGPDRFTIPGLRDARQLEVYATSNSPMAGGIRYVRILNQDDIDSARITLENDLIKEYSEQWQQEIPDSFDYEEIFVDISGFQVEENIGDEVSILNVSANISISGIFFPAEAIEQFANSALIESTDRGLSLVSKSMESVRLQLLDIDQENNTVIISGEVDGRVIIDDSNPLLRKDRLTQLSENEVIEVLHSPDLIETINVNFTPFWLKRTPRLPDHINIEVLYP